MARLNRRIRKRPNGPSFPGSARSNLNRRSGHFSWSVAAMPAGRNLQRSPRAAISKAHSGYRLARTLFAISGLDTAGNMGAGGLQALVKTGLPIAGKRIVVGGSGPLLLAVAAYLKKRGAKIILIADRLDRQLSLNSPINCCEIHEKSNRQQRCDVRYWACHIDSAAGFRQQVAMLD